MADRRVLIDTSVITVAPDSAEGRTITQQKIWVDIEVIEADEETDGYALLDQMIGLCHTDREDASVN